MRNPIAILIVLAAVVLVCWLALSKAAEEPQRASPPDVRQTPSLVGEGLGAKELLPPRGVRNELGADAHSGSQDLESAVLRLVVSDFQGRPVETGRAIVLGGERRVADAPVAEGASALRVPINSGLELRVDCPGYVVSVHALTLSADRELRIALVASGHESVVRGRVVTANGSPVEGAKVAAWSAFSFPWSIDGIHSSLDLASGSVALTSTSTDGRFELVVDSRVRDWRVAAGGNGHVAKSIVDILVPNSDSVEITVYPLLGRLVQWKDSLGMPILAGPLLHSGSEEMSVDDAGLELVARVNPGIVLAGIDYIRTGNAMGFETLVLCIDTDVVSSKRTGRVHVERRIPGYAPFTGTVDLLPVMGGIETLRILLDPVATGWCDTELRIAPSCELALESKAEIPSGRVWMHSLESADAHFDFAIKSFGNAVVSLGRVPKGRYRASWETSNHFYKSQLSESTVFDLTGETGIVELDTSGLSCVAIHARMADGFLLNGLLQVQVEQLTSAGVVGQMTFAGFQSPPYVIDNLPSGKYRITAVYPGGAWRVPNAVLDVVSNSIVECYLER